jgi:hypothetical protein
MAKTGDKPVLTPMRGMPVEGHDSMLLNLRGAHAPWFARTPLPIADILAKVAR